VAPGSVPPREAWKPPLGQRTLRDGYTIVSLSLRPSQHRSELRPMRPKPLITTFVEGPAACAVTEARTSCTCRGRTSGNGCYSEHFGVATPEAALPHGTDIVIEPMPASTSTSARTEVLLRRSAAVPATSGLAPIAPRTWR